MKEFFLPQDSNDAFQRWNQDCFKIDTEMAPGTYEERVRCQSRPGLPLFMICVYGFDEFVEPMIENREHIFHAENSFGERPLEVAALSENFDTMVLLYNAASSAHLSTIRAEKWLEAAAQSHNLDIWNFAVKHIPNIRSKSAMVEAARNPVYGKAMVKAARNPVHGKEMVSSLLETIIDINEEVLAEILKGCASFEISDMILAHFSPVRFTESMVEAAVQNLSINPELTEMILSKGQDLRVSEFCILTAFCELYSSSSTRVAVLKALLSHSIRCEISEEMICKIASLSPKENFECLDLLLQYCLTDRITEDCLVAATMGGHAEPTVLKFFLNHALDHKISQQVLQSAMQSPTGDRITMLLSRPECPSLLEESLYVMTESEGWEEKLLLTVMQECESVHIIDYYLQSCAANRSLQDLKHMVYLPRAIPISKDVLCASTRNRINAADMLEFLSQVKSGFELETSEDLLFQALSNRACGFELARVLADQWNVLPVSERSVMAAVRLDNDGTSTFEFLLQHCESAEGMLTENVLQAAIEGDNVEFVEFFKQKKPNFQVNEENLKAAINGSCTNNAILRILLLQQDRCITSRSVLKTAAQKGDGSTLELLLEEPGVSDLLPDVLQDEASGGITFEAVQLAASTEGMPRDNLYEFSTKKLDLLLSKYSDPKLDSSRLIEVAAERGDGKFVVQYLLSRFPETLITQRALLVAVSNEVALTSLLELLLEHSHAVIDSKLLQLAAGNKSRGTPMIEILLAKRPAGTDVEREVIVAALRNPFSGRSLLDLFL